MLLTIALYAYRLRDEIKIYKMPTEQVLSLKRLLWLRERLVKQRTGFKASFKEQKRVLVKKDNKILFNTQKQMMSYLSKQIKAVEKEMNLIIKNDDTLNEQFKLIISVKGVGSQTAIFMIVYTDSFQNLKHGGNLHLIVVLHHFLIHQELVLEEKTKWVV